MHGEQFELLLIEYIPHTAAPHANRLKIETTIVSPEYGRARLTDDWVAVQASDPLFDLQLFVGLQDELNVLLSDDTYRAEFVSQLRSFSNSLQFTSIGTITTDDPNGTLEQLLTEHAIGVRSS